MRGEPIAVSQLPVPADPLHETEPMMGCAVAEATERPLRRERLTQPPRYSASSGNCALKLLLWAFGPAFVARTIAMGRVCQRPRGPPPVSIVHSLTSRRAQLAVYHLHLVPAAACNCVAVGGRGPPWPRRLKNLEASTASRCLPRAKWQPFQLRIGYMIRPLACGEKQ